MKKKISPLFISIIIHLFLVAIFIAIYLSFTNQKKSYSEEKIYIQLNNMPQLAKNEVKPYVEKKIEEKIEEIQEIKKEKIIEKVKPKPKTIIKEKELIKIDEKTQVQVDNSKNKPKEKMLVNTTIENNIIKDEEKQDSKESKKINFTKEYIDKNKDLIVKLLKENLYYPRSARKRGIVGEIVVKFTLSKDALVYSLEIISSKSDILSRGALKTITDLSGKFPSPKEEIILIVPINYSLK